MVYYVIALALYMHSSYREVLRCLLEGVQWLRDPSAESEGGRQVGDLAGPHAAGLGAAASNCTIKWSSPSRFSAPKARGTASGAW